MWLKPPGSGQFWGKNGRDACMNAVGIIWIMVEIVGLIDALRHSGADWAYADRNRSFWLIFMFFFGPIFVVPYLFLVRPRFPGAAEHPDQAFRKQ